jgi:hypothetical protein
VNLRLPGWELPCSASSLCHCHHFNGHEFSATYKLIPWLGATADFGGHYGTVTGSSSGHVQTHLFGPELALPAQVAPFVQALVGVAHQAAGSGPLAAA